VTLRLSLCPSAAFSDDALVTVIASATSRARELRRETDGDGENAPET
jgi:hypothetical protein